MYLTYSQLGFLIAAVFMAGCSMGCLVMCLFQAAGRVGEDELPEPHGYIDQDGETFYPGRDAWKHSSVKVPHADATAATFHRAE
ncbi:hypothetical protein DFLDMN_001507 [Cupriavidus sp. H19C3]|uniref:hypothetical protein n=1 Tax=Cupriavidus sp. H19C3 TaxID=3241603 RepID=UPI003BF7DC61